MRHVKAFFFILICCLLPRTAHAENKKMIVSCAELTLIEIKQPPPGCLVPNSACGDKCFYIDFTMNDFAAQRLIREVNAYKHVPRDFYIGDHLLFAMEPFHLDLPYSQKASAARAYLTLEDALDEVRKICPNAAVKTPDTVRR